MIKLTKNNIIKLCDILIEASFYLLIPSVTFSNSLVEISATVMISAWVIKKALSRDLRAFKTIPAGILGAYFIWVLISCSGSSYFHESFRGIFKVLESVFIFLVAASELTEKRHRKVFFYVTAVTALVVCFDGVYQHISGIDLIRGRELISMDHLRRISASFPHPNSLGIFLFIVSAVMGGYFVSSVIGARDRALAGITFLFSAYCLFLTRSRGAWLSFAASIFILAVLRSRKLVLTVILLGIIAFVSMPSGVKDGLKESFDLSTGTSLERVMLWKGTIDMIKAHPVRGFGINTYSKNFPDFKPKEYVDHRYSHNCYLQMASEIGIPGAVIFLCFLLTVFVLVIRGILRMDKGIRKDTATALAAPLIGFALGSAIDTHLYSLTLSVFFYCLLGFCLASTRDPEEG